MGAVDPLRGINVEQVQSALSFVVAAGDLGAEWVQRGAEARCSSEVRAALCALFIPIGSVWLGASFVTSNKGVPFISLSVPSKIKIQPLPPLC